MKTTAITRESVCGINVEFSAQELIVLATKREKLEKYLLETSAGKQFGKSDTLELLKEFHGLLFNISQDTIGLVETHEGLFGSYKEPDNSNLCQA